MNPFSVLLNTIERIGNLTGAIRARTIEQTRIQRNGGTSAQLLQRNRELNDRLSAVADTLEDALA